MATGNMHKKFGEVRPYGFRLRPMRADRQTHKHTDYALITILRNPDGTKAKTTCTMATVAISNAHARRVKRYC